MPNANIQRKTASVPQLPTRSQPTSTQKATLSAVFRHTQHPSREEYEVISRIIDMEIRAVMNWFRHRRSTRYRLKQGVDRLATPLQCIRMSEIHLSLLHSPNLQGQFSSADFVALRMVPRRPSPHPVQSPLQAMYRRRIRVLESAHGPVHQRLQATPDRSPGTGDLSPETLAAAHILCGLRSSRR
ncbi:hypothetical protein BDN72DRAFT_904170 [Pluteus cervinus]|uniref:Uncharacterized protein n=1 Tax=Pluteus cervinus TaxID=181527 RepID=A0ACD3A6A0_9AGAR|nr:hypothetical protein BDN72DRAFT_904170 [Pluteus cervinus]